MKIKVCGMKYKDNIAAVAALQPDYMGFIFYDKSPRNFDTEIPSISEDIKKVGVFVDAPINIVLEKIYKFGFKALQLHGQESIEYCEDLKSKLAKLPQPLEIWKVFSIKDTFDFSRLTPYEGIVDCFLFDTKGKEKGGNGYTFDWTALKNYPSKTPFILSGGIGLNEIDNLKAILNTDLPIYAIDVNSKFEIEPGLKNREELEKFKNALLVDC
ncbi:phosphoribosylanthranilate isomerase [Aquimarina sp. D1M17]|uniref:phosphoribosylanthranilate isomerase n=1 Tax=Aquimarina acroporae TaxID=2937283 RepID=UPI0020BF7452|nr:phosphoribosylanthranilate isomerase [Aquimarina acroporae]MCK8521905.1 phosphoribosylanthranilate isomerase [Aquimarina acroporae]